MESNFIKSPINGFVNIKERIPAFFLDQKAPEVRPVKMSNLALKNGRISLSRITGNDSRRGPRGHWAVQRGPLSSNVRLLAHCREESAPPMEGGCPPQAGAPGGVQALLTLAHRGRAAR